MLDRVIAVKTAFEFLALVTLLVGATTDARADGGQVRNSEKAGDFQVTVFTSPQPLRAGPVDVSVLVQDVETGDVAADATVIVDVTDLAKSFPPQRAVATAETATNKLLRSALLELPAAGKWSVRVECKLPGGTLHVTQFDVEALTPLPPWLTFWPWIGWPVVAIVLFVIHRRLVARQRAWRVGGGMADKCGRVSSSAIVGLSPFAP